MSEKTLRIGDALIVVDFQNDFAHPDGSLYVSEGERCAHLIEDWLENFEDIGPVFLTRDWHPEDHISFKTWPPHCVQGTWGAEFHEGITVLRSDTIVDKAFLRDTEEYSGFYRARQLFPDGIKRLFVCGLATDYCVKATVLDALAAGYDVFVIGEAIKAVNIKPDDGLRAIADMIEAGARFI